MDGKYLNNKKQYIQFLKDWIFRITGKNNPENFFDDYHIDEIDSSITKKSWFDSAFKIYEEYSEYLKSHYPQMDVMLCIDLGGSKVKYNYQIPLDNNMVANTDTPPSIYLFNKLNYNIIDTLKECILLPNLLNNDAINVFYKEEYDEIDNNFYETIFISDIILK